MLQQRKHAWPERKKKPKSEMTPAGKVSSHPSGRFHKTFTGHRQHEGGRMSFSDGNAAGSALKGPPGGGRAFRKCSLAMSQFLPPIKALALEGSLALQAKQPSVLLGEAAVRDPEDSEVWRTEGSPKTSEKENYDSTGHKETSGLGSPPGCALSKSVSLPNHWQEKTFVVGESVGFPKTSEKENYDSTGHKETSCLGPSLSKSVPLPNHWQDKTFVVGESVGFPKTSEKENYDSTGHKETSGLGSPPGCALSKSVPLPNHWQEKTFVVGESVGFPKPPARKVPTPDLYKSCLLVLSTRRKEPKAQQVPEIFRSPAGRPQTRSKTPRKDLLTWRSTEDLLKGGEKRSSGDSAFGTDTWSENVEVDLGLGLEVGGLEMDYYSQQRIINWILQVNTALFSPSADSLKCSLTEQDTSIKIVYEGD